MASINLMYMSWSKIFSASFAILLGVYEGGESEFRGFKCRKIKLKCDRSRMTFWPDFGCLSADLMCRGYRIVIGGVQ
jgi:hypothetical protein